MTINCKGTLIDLKKPKVMGVLNVTPDSFYDGGRYKDEVSILRQTEKLLGEGAAFIDLGAYSSRPNAADISEEEELRRILPVVDLLLNNFPDIYLSIDTFRSKVARSCLENGAAMINDISAGNLDSGMMATISEFKVPYIMMHIKGNPQNMVQKATYDKLLEEILHYLSEKVALAKSFGINDIILDPGFGFSKNTFQNFSLLRNLHLFKTFGLPVLVGLSRKSMICKTLGNKPSEALNGTTVLNTYALTKGANILRVHDVKEAMECIELLEALNQTED
ncbi:dihydropteroate synthase [Eudoraea adriatica]|uniref:dihydropteroate synthase n=1 Tax=Eudoraea adriatica TaxID=446681 RepID=UPI0003673127|nr:dihydropteroate synthase [Eudoraea adriatica]